MSPDNERPLDIGVLGARGIPSTYGGFETFLSVLLPELAGRGHQVTIYCRRGEVIDVGGSWRGVHQKFLPAVRSKQLSTLTHGFVACYTAARRRHDVVLVVNAANAPACALARAFGTRIALNVDGQEWLRGKWSALGKAYYRLAARLVRVACSAPIADCRAMADSYADSFGIASTVIPYCWVDLDVERGLGVLDEFGLRVGEFFACGGRLVPENNIERIAGAYVRTARSEPLVVMGAANYASPVADRLRQLADIDSRVQLVGHLADRSAYGAIVRSARCYVHAHSVGGMNPALVEAMGVGANIIALGTSFNTEVLGPSGTYFQDFGPGLTQLLETMSDETALPTFANRIAAEQRAKGVYGLGSVTDAYESLLRATASAPARATIPTDLEWPRNKRPAVS